MNRPPSHPRASWKALIEWMEWSLSALETNLSAAEVEARAVDVYTAMGGGLRRFHTLDHLFRFEPSDPLETLAVLYHDVVYWSVDGTWPAGYAAALSALAPDGPQGPVGGSAEVPFLVEILAVFGLRPGDKPSAGTNELFSALAFAGALGQALGRSQTLAVAACIEATIPFRGPGARKVLWDRLASLGVPEDECHRYLARAVHLANQDVGDFRHEDPGTFLGGTWNLLPELNPDLRITAVFTIQAYRKALGAMDRFFAFLTPDLLFDSWGAEPGEAVLAGWKAQAAKNLSVAREYLGAKLLASSLLEAAARETGPDAPLSLFMGAATDPPEDRLESRLPPLAGSPDSDPVSFLLAWGRSTQSSFDLTNSPLADWIHRQLTPDQRNAHLAQAARLFASDLGARPFLEAWDPKVTGPLLSALAAFVPTRRAALLALVPRTGGRSGPRA